MKDLFKVVFILMIVISSTQACDMTTDCIQMSEPCAPIDLCVEPCDPIED